MKLNPKYYKLLDHPYNKTISNERCIEVPIGLEFVRRNMNFDLIEIGCVLPYYQEFSSHDCIDPIDIKANTKAYAEDIDYTGKTVVSISTLEHIGNGDYDLPVKEGLANYVLEKIYISCDRCLISWPIGFNKILDSYVFSNKCFKYTTFKRIGETKWILSNNINDFKIKYDYPFHAGNGLIWIHKNL